MDSSSRQQGSADTRRSLLLVSKDVEVVQVVRRVCRTRYSVKHAKTKEQAKRVLRQTASYDCSIVSSGVGPRDGFAAVAALRQWRAGLPILVLGDSADGELANRAFALQVGFIVAASDLEQHLTAFLRRVASRLVCLEQARYTVLEAFASQVGLSIREAEVLAAAESGVPRGRIADALGIAENTVKTHVRAILRKTNHSSLSEVVWMVRNGVSLASGPGAA